jgi:PIN domain nuclease of toxin-antitoxin system
LTDYLLDTHVLLWALFEPKKLSALSAEILTNSDFRKFISISSMWEISIKNRIGKLPLPMGIEGIFLRAEAVNFGLIGINQQQVEIFNSLPLLHRDPFDGMLIATAISEKMTLLTADENIQKYDMPWVW